MTRNIFTSAILLALLSLLVGSGTFAYFSDVEASTGNMITAGTFDLELSGQSLPFQVWEYVMPGWSESQTHGVRNIGSIAGEVYITAENFAEPTGNWAEPDEPESSVEVSAEDFAKILFMKIYADIDKDHDFEEDEVIYDGPVYGMETERFGIDPGEYICLKFLAYLPIDLDDPATAENEDDNLYQADGVVFDIVFHGTTEITITP